MMQWNEEGKLMERGLVGVEQREKWAFGEWPFILYIKMNVCLFVCLYGTYTNPHF